MKKKSLIRLCCIAFAVLASLSLIKRLYTPVGVENAPQSFVKPKPPLKLPPTMPPPTEAEFVAALHKPWKWSGEITQGPEGLTAYLGLALPNTLRQKQMDIAAPWVLCRMIKKYPGYALQVNWNTGFDGSSGADLSLSYKPEKQHLTEMVFGFGGGSGVHYSGVADEMLLQIEKEARQSKSKLDLNRLTKFGCKAERFYGS